MSSYAKGLLYLGLFLFVTVAIHEIGHLVVARRLISQEANIRLFPDFPWSNVLGFVKVPESVSYPLWKGVATALAGPLLATILMFVIWFNTRNATIAVISSFFAVNQLAYSVLEPLHIITVLPSWSPKIPLIIAGFWVLPYAFYISKNPEKWD